METIYISCAQEKVFWEMKEITDCKKQLIIACPEQGFMIIAIFD